MNMIKDNLTELLEPYDEAIKKLIYRVLDHEQQMISMVLGPNSTNLRELKSSIKREVEKIAEDGYEAR